MPFGGDYIQQICPCTVRIGQYSLGEKYILKKVWFSDCSTVDKLFSNTFRDELLFSFPIIIYIRMWCIFLYRYASFCLFTEWYCFVVKTSNTITWTLHLLSMYPQCQDRLYKEVSTLVTADRIPSAEEVTQMPYLRAVIKESLRWDWSERLQCYDGWCSASTQAISDVNLCTTMIPGRWSRFKGPLLSVS